MKFKIFELEKDEGDEILLAIFSHLAVLRASSFMDLLDIRLVCKRFHNLITTKLTVESYLHIISQVKQMSHVSGNMRKMMEGKRDFPDPSNMLDETKRSMRERGIRIMSFRSLSHFNFEDINLWGGYPEMKVFVKRKHVFLKNLYIRFPPPSDMEKLVRFINSPKTTVSQYNLESLGIDMFRLHREDIITSEKNTKYISDLSRILFSRVFRGFKFSKLKIPNIDFNNRDFDRKSLLRFILSHPECKTLEVSSRFLNSYWNTFFNELNPKRNNLSRITRLEIEISQNYYRTAKNFYSNTLQYNLSPSFEYLKEFSINEVNSPELVSFLYENIIIKKKKNRKIKKLEITFLRLHDIHPMSKKLYEIFSKMKSLKLYFVDFVTKVEIEEFVVFLLSHFADFETLEISNLCPVDADDINTINEKDNYQHFEIQGTMVLSKLSHWVDLGNETHKRVDKKMEILSNFGEGDAEQYSVFVYQKKCRFCDKKKKKSLKRCSRCKCVFYCDSSCQNSDWKRHKKCCRARKSKKELIASREELEYILKQDAQMVNIKHLIQQFEMQNRECFRCGFVGRQEVYPQTFVNRFGLDDNIELVFTCSECGNVEKVPLSNK